MPPAGECSNPVKDASLICCNLPRGFMSFDSVQPSAAACSAACLTNATCAAFTWHDDTVKGYAHFCYHVLDFAAPWGHVRADPGHVSGICHHKAVAEELESEAPWPSDYAPPGYLHPADQAPSRDRGWRAGVPPLPQPEAGSTLFVNAITGSDFNTGTSANDALRTVAAAVAKVPSLPAPRFILLATGGTHYLNETIRLGAEHSSTTIANADAHGDAVVSGGIPLASLQWSKEGAPTAKGAQIWRASLPAGTPPFLELFDTSGNHSSNGSSQVRLVAARSPDGNPELDQSNYKAQGVWSKLGHFGNESVHNRRWSTNVTVVVNDSYNRGGMFPVYEVGLHGPADNFQPPVSFWASQAGMKAGGGSLYAIPSAVVTPPGSPSNASLLSAEPGGFAFMMQVHGWGSWVFELTGSATNASGFTRVQFGKGGQQEARGNGGNGGGSFYLSHRRELLDNVGEWHHDATTDTLFVATAGDPPPSDGLVAPVVQRLFSIEGTPAAQARDIRLSSLVFRHAAPTFMNQYTVPSGGDYTVARTAAVTLNGTMNVTVDHGLFDGVGGNGVALVDFNRHALITANEMRFLGENGVVMVGSTDWVDGRAGTQPRFCTVDGNLIHHIGLYTKQSCAVLSAVACENTISQK